MPTAVKAVVDQLSSCDPDISIDGLRDAISEATGSLKAVREGRIPEYLPALRGVVRSGLSSRQVITVGDFRKWCLDAGIIDVEEHFEYLQILAELGDLFFWGQSPLERLERRDNYQGKLDAIPRGQRYFHEHEPEPLFNRYVVNPQWLCHTVYSVIRSSETSYWMDNDDIAEAQYKYESTQAAMRSIGTIGTDVIRAFLKRVALCYYDKTQGTYLFPRGLPMFPRLQTPDWASAYLRWKYIPEAAFDRYIVHIRKTTDPLELGDLRVFRNAVLEGPKDAPRVLTLIDTHLGIIEMRVTPGLDIGVRASRFERLKDFFVVELLHQSPCHVQPFAVPQHQATEVTSRISAIRNLLSELVLDPTENELNFVRYMTESVYATFEGKKPTDQASFLAGFFFRDFVSQLHESRIRNERKLYDFDEIFQFLSQSCSVRRNDRIENVMLWSLFGNTVKTPVSGNAMAVAYQRTKNGFQGLYRELIAERAKL